MNIYALKGHKVKFITLSEGYNYHQEIVQKHLEINKEYNIFEDVNEQDEQLDKNHVDYYRYNLK